MTINTQKLREALELIEYELQASYNNAKPVCCGHGYGECCGNPEPEWDAGDQKIMDVLGPVQRALSDAVSQADAQTAEIARLRDALLWTAGALQMACAVDVIMGEADGISINNETRTVAQILDAADAALAQEQGESDGN